MIIEWLKIQVVPELRETFIQKDDEIWTTALSRYPGFLGKQVWINPKQADEVVLAIHWESREAWNSVSPAHMEETEQLFAKALGKDAYHILEGKEYQVRKFSRQV